MLRELLAKSAIMLIVVYQKPLGFKKPTLPSPKYPHGCFTLALSNSAFKGTFLKMYPEVSGCLPYGYMPPSFLKHTHTQVRLILQKPIKWAKELKSLLYFPPTLKKILAVAKHELYCFFLGSGGEQEGKKWHQQMGCQLVRDEARRCSFKNTFSSWLEILQSRPESRTWAVF